MSKESKTGYLVGMMEIIDKISKANHQILDGLIHEKPEESQSFYDYYGELADALSRMKKRIIKNKTNEKNTPNN